MQQADTATDFLVPPVPVLGIGITGHRSKHPVFAANRDAIAATLSRLFGLLGEMAATAAMAGGASTTPLIRLHSLLAYGADLMAVQAAQASGWPVVAPLPFGCALNLAINAQPGHVEDMERLLAGDAADDAATEARANEIRDAARAVAVFALAEQDAAVTERYRSHLSAPADEAAALSFAALCSDRAAMAARVMIEQSDLVVGIWDGETRGAYGGTRHTIEAALAQGVPVLWIDARQPDVWRVLQASEELANLGPRAEPSDDTATLATLVRQALCPHGDGWTGAPLREKWRSRSNRLLHAYRRIELLFGQPGQRPLRSLMQRYEHPDMIATGSGAVMLAAADLPSGDPAMPAQISRHILRPFAWADGISTWLADAYRGSMVASFFLSAFAIIGGMAYLPFASIEHKWGFAAFELVLLAAIVVIFITGKRRRWHERWFDTRRVTEYFRQAPVLLLLGAARTSGRWPRGAGGNWPETYVRHALRGIGLPNMTVAPGYLRRALMFVRDQHVAPQRTYHQDKASRLRRAQHNLDRLSETLFVFAVISVALYLAIEAGAAMDLLPSGWPKQSAKAFTFFGVLFPTLGGAFAGVHYFGDFERFAAISDITAEKLGAVMARIEILLAADDAEISYARTSDIAHAIDDIVVDEIEGWQAVFSGKHITVPV